METIPTRILAVTGADWIRTRLSSILSGENIDLHYAQDRADGVEQVKESEFELLVVEYGDDPLHELLSTARTITSASRDAAIVLLCTPDQLEEAESHLTHGVCRILNPLATEERLARAFDEVLNHDPRFQIRALVRLSPKDSPKRTKLMAQTENISDSGMLIRFGEIIPIGTRFKFDLEIPGLGSPIRGEAAVVRLTHGPTESVQGFGARFISFSSDGARRLRVFIEEQARVSNGSDTPSD